MLKEKIKCLKEIFGILDLEVDKVVENMNVFDSKAYSSNSNNNLGEAI